MFEAERQHMKTVDKEILEASGSKLKKLQELDRATQLLGTTFYDVVSSNKNRKKETIHFTTKYNQKQK